MQEHLWHPLSFSTDALCCFATQLRSLFELFSTCEEALVKFSCWSQERTAEKKNSVEVLSPKYLPRERLGPVLKAQA